MHYFKYEMKLEMIPYVEKQIKQYLIFIQKQLGRLDEPNKIKVKKLITKKLKQIDDFYNLNYVDYRAPMILKSRKLLYEFLINHQFTQPDENQKQIIEQRKSDSNPQNNKNQKQKNRKITEQKSYITLMSSRQKQKRNLSNSNSSDIKISLENNKLKKQNQDYTQIQSTRKASISNNKQVKQKQLSPKKAKQVVAKQNKVQKQLPKKVSKNQYLNYLKNKSKQ